MVHDYYFSRSIAGQQPHFYNYFLDLQPKYNIEVYLPNKVEKTISDKDAWFTLQKSSETNNPSELIIDSKIWNFDGVASNRLNIREAYIDFLKNLEESKLDPVDIQQVKTRLAEVIPVTFEELLFYYYGLDQTAGYVDLQSGMRLRVDYQSYQLVHPVQNQKLHGYTGSGSSYYQIVTQRTVTNNDVQVYLSFDPFIARMHKTTEGGNSVAGVIDLESSAHQSPYLRLIYPGEYADIASEGWLGTKKNVTLLGADTIANLKMFTEKYKSNGSVSGGQGHAFYFRGRAAVIPEFVVFVNGQPEHIALGTTLRQLLDRYLSVPPAMEGQELGDLGLQGFLRLFHQGPHGQPVYRTVHIEHYQVYADGTDIYDIPLLKGDRIRIH